MPMPRLCWECCATPMAIGRSKATCLWADTAQCREEYTKVPTGKFALLLGRWKRLRRSRPKKPTQALNWPRIGVQRA
eukprot:scaffold3694_cov104-Isochrysis_galbana.AAC.2